MKVVSAYDGGGVGDQILVHADSPITTIADLRGKRIAVGKGSSAHGHVLAQLKQGRAHARRRPAGVPAARRRVVRVHQRQVDAWAIWDPYTAQAEPSNCRCAASAEAKDVTNGYWFGVASDETLADPKRNTALQRPAGPLREGRPVGQGPSRGVGAELRRRRGSRSQGRRGVPVAQPAAAHRAVRRGGRLRTEARRPVRRIQARSPSAPKFADWVDRRYNDALRPLLISTN